jgi:hypothetical protein
MVASILEELGVDDDVRRGIMGGTLEGILAGDLPDLSPPRPRPRAGTGTRRCASTATSRPPPADLDAAAGRDRPDGTGPDGGVRRRRGARGVPELIDVAGRLWAEAPSSGNGSPASVEAWASHLRKVYALVHLAQAALFCPRAAARVPV